MVTEATYHTPTSIDSACELLADIPDAIVVAGGQSLGLLTKEGIITPEVLVDINDIDGLEGIERDGDHLRFGAVTTHRTIEQSPLVASEMPVLQDAAAHIADMQIRNAGTIGGVTAFADPTAEYPLVYLALDAEIDARTVDGTQTYRARDFFEGYYQSALDPDELVTEIRIPVLRDDQGAAYEKLAFRENDRAVVNVVSVVTVEDGSCTAASIAVGSVTDTPVLADTAADELVGSDLSDDAIEAAAETASSEVPVDADPSISVEYREAMVRTHVRETLADARTRAEGGER